MKKIILALLLTTMVITNSANAGFGLRNVFDNLYVNTTSAGVYKDAASGWYSGGGAAIRTKNTGFQPFAFSPPALNTGCGGIDAYMGSFSMISGSELVNLATNIGRQAPVYGFHLGMKTYAPQIEQVLQNIRNLTMQLNQAGIAHCHANQAVFAGLLPQDSAMYETVCQDLAGSGGSDLGGQRKKCRSHMAQKQAAATMQLRDENLLLDDYNIFVKAANAAGIPKELHAALMSMTGTIVIKDRLMIPYQSLAKDRRNMDIYLNGGSNASLYGCDNDKCLSVALSNDVAIKPDESYAGQVKKKLEALKDKMIKQNAEYTLDEQGLIDSVGTRFDVFKHIMLEAAANTSILDSSSEVVAKYVFFEHMSRVASTIKGSVAMLKQRQFNEAYLAQYEKDLDEVLEFAKEGMREVSKEADQTDARAEKILRHVTARERG